MMARQTRGLVSNARGAGAHVRPAADRRRAVLAILGVALFGAACSSEPGAASGDAPKKAAGKVEAAAEARGAKAETEPVKLVVYCGRSEALVGETLKAFDAAHPEIELDVRYNKTPALASQLLAEGAESPADVLWFQDSGYLGALAKKGLLEKLPASITGRVDPRFRDKDGHWVGITGRLRVLVYNTATVKPEDLPRSLKDLADPKWKGKLGWAPANASFQAHVSVLRHLWGEEETRGWLEAVQKNEPARYPKNSPQVKAAAAGEIALGWVNHYYLHKLKREGFAAANHSFPADGDAGNVLMLAGAAIRKGSPRRAAAEKLLAWLLTDETQKRFARETFEYPTVPGVPTHPDVSPMKTLKLAPIDQAWLADVEPTLKLLQEVGLQ